MYFDFSISLTVLAILTTPATSFTAGTARADGWSLATMPKLVLVDRDGVVNEDVGAPGVLHSSQLELTPGAGLALGRLRRAGCKIALITNQSCVGKGLITEGDLVHNIHGRLQEMLLDEDKDANFDRIFYCTSLKESNDHRMKPNPGMIEEAMELLFFGVEDTCSYYCDTTVFVGDALRDLEAAARAGVPTRILVETGYGRGIMGGEEAPDVDGTVKVVDENENENNIELTTTTTTTMDNSSDSSPKPYIFPFLYAKNFCSAVEWILTSSTKTHTRKKQ